MHRGYFALWRKFQEHQFWKEKRVFSRAEAWIDILWEAQHKEEPVQVILKQKILVCNYGETLKSIRTWARRWGWGEAKTHRFLKLLKTLGQIDTVSETVTTRIKVLNYKEYDPRNSKSETQMEHNWNTSETQVMTDNNDKKEKKDNKETFMSDSIEYQLANYLYNHIKKRNPNHKNPNLQTWSKNIDLMMRIDKRNQDDIMAVIKWCQHDTPDKHPDENWKGWASNILSTKKLRDKFDKLYLKMNELTPTILEPTNYQPPLEEVLS